MALLAIDCRPTPAPADGYVHRLAKAGNDSLRTAAAMGIGSKSSHHRAAAAFASADLPFPRARLLEQELEQRDSERAREAPRKLENPPDDPNRPNVSS
jgi:hypothetical protein